MNDLTPSDTQNHDLDVPIALRKGKHSCTYHIPSFVFYAKLSSIKTVGEALNYSG